METVATLRIMVIEIGVRVGGAMTTVESGDWTGCVSVCRDVVQSLSYVVETFHS